MLNYQALLMYLFGLLGAQDCGYSSSAQGMFPRGGTDLALYFYKKSNRKLICELNTQMSDELQETKDQSTGNLIRDAIESRIR